MASNDWTPVVLRKEMKAKPKTEAALAAAKAKGQVEVVAKVHHTAPSNARMLDDNDTADFKLPTVSHDFKIALAKARQAKGWQQKDLAAKLNVKPAVINDYESGKVVPQPAFIQQMNRVLGVTLPKIPKKKTVGEPDE